MKLFFLAVGHGEREATAFKVHLGRVWIAVWVGLGCVFGVFGYLWIGWIVSLAMFGLDWIVVDLAQVWCG